MNNYQNSYESSVGSAAKWGFVTKASAAVGLSVVIALAVGAFGPRACAEAERTHVETQFYAQQKANEQKIADIDARVYEQQAQIRLEDEQAQKAQARQHQADLNQQEIEQRERDFQKTEELKGAFFAALTAETRNAIWSVAAVFVVAIVAAACAFSYKQIEQARSARTVTRAHLQITATHVRRRELYQLLAQIHADVQTLRADLDPANFSDLVTRLAQVEAWLAHLQTWQLQHDGNGINSKSRARGDGRELPKAA